MSALRALIIVLCLASCAAFAADLADCDRHITFDNHVFFKSAWELQNVLAQSCYPGNRKWPKAECDAAYKWMRKDLLENPRKTIPYSQALDYFEFLRAQPLGHEMGEAGCEARAHLMAKILEDLGVQTRKVFIIDRQNRIRLPNPDDAGHPYDWWFHVAPVVNVQFPDGHTAELVLDTALFRHPVLLNIWLDHVRGRQTCYKERPREGMDDPSGCVYTVTSRFDYKPANIGTGIDSWRAEDVKDAEREAERFFKLSSQRRIKP